MSLAPFLTKLKTTVWRWIDADIQALIQLAHINVRVACQASATKREIQEAIETTEVLLSLVPDLERVALMHGYDADLVSRFNVEGTLDYLRHCLEKK